MLHILWMLIKFILILIGIVLGLVLLLALLILFCPVRYRAAVQKEPESALTELTAQARVSWLFGGISLRAEYTDGRLKQKVRVLGIPVLEILKKWKRRKRKAKKPGNQNTGKQNTEKRNTKEISKLPPPEVNSNAAKETADIEDDLTAAEMKAREQAAKGQATEEQEAEKPATENQPSQTGAGSSVQILQTEAAPSMQGAPTNLPAAQTKPDDTAKSTNTDDSTRTDDAQKTASHRAFFQMLRNKLAAIPAKLKGILKKLQDIPALLRRTAFTIRRICDKIDWWRALTEDPRTQAGIRLAKEKLWLLLRHVFPTKITGSVTFGSEDPSVTGAALAVLGMTMPFHKNRIEICPVFENRNLFYGNADLKGRIYGIVFIRTAIELYFNKNIKYIISRWKHKED